MMNLLLNELEQIIVQNLKSINVLENKVEQMTIEKDDLIKEISLSIIYILDSFESIEESLVERQYDKIEEVHKTVNRYRIIKKKLFAVLQKQGVAKIEFPDNRLIVGICEVVDTEPDSSRKNDEIVSVIRNGYIRGKDLIRPAELIVVKN